ncbi:GNAT family N-acetyltransferase [Micromonospora sp. 4G55]|uniref:GNAT family N-acetyltransferase n=1 Tax=Micromonospora sp. 4G55 TaxID=2806102 RepID=UPI001A63E4DF|nr:GNAT family protein [Micromonospora sp. 4G55]MBM0258068.1 GNAT family N-acetyltransferase [Micromonospora sp. 4G55]MBM0259339.1 GNAT family N-acetyltransferase [Micromonospora sp. 4G55]
MLVPDLPLRTDRLDLRLFTADDFAALRLPVPRRRHPLPLLRGERRGRQPGGAGPQARPGALRAEGDVLNLALVLRETGAVIGDVLLIWTSVAHRQGEIGYVLHPDHAGHGYATEAAREMLRLGFDELGLHRIVGRLDARNTASARVLERLGMRREAHLRENELVKGEWTDEAVYALLAREWRAGTR